MRKLPETAFVPLTPQEIASLEKGNNPCRLLRQSRGKGITQRQLAQDLGLEDNHRNYVCRLETGAVVGSLALWFQICQFFHASLDEIAPFVPGKPRRKN